MAVLSRHCCGKNLGAIDDASPRRPSAIRPAQRNDRQTPVDSIVLGPWTESELCPDWIEALKSLSPDVGYREVSAIREY